MEDPLAERMEWVGEQKRMHAAEGGMEHMGPVGGFWRNAVGKLMVQGIQVLGWLATGNPA
jgi:hypothetical protein